MGKISCVVLVVYYKYFLHKNYMFETAGHVYVESYIICQTTCLLHLVFEYFHLIFSNHAFPLCSPHVDLFFCVCKFTFRPSDSYEPTTIFAYGNLILLSFPITFSVVEDDWRLDGVTTSYISRIGFLN